MCCSQILEAPSPTGNSTHGGEGLLVKGEEGVHDHVHAEDCPVVEDSCKLVQYVFL